MEKCATVLPADSINFTQVLDARDFCFEQKNVQSLKSVVPCDFTIFERSLLFQARNLAGL